MEISDLAKVKSNICSILEKHLSSFYRNSHKIKWQKKKEGNMSIQLKGSYHRE